jgi:murein DD-endopeptidase MepM/ murein hydrolase activator NlpD
LKQNRRFPSVARVVDLIGPQTRVRAMQLLSVGVVAWAGLMAASHVDVAPSHTLASAALGAVQPHWRPETAAEAAASLEAAFDVVEVVVRRNDTLDQIFRRLELSLTDLANLRAMDGLKSALDRLHPGEQLTLAYRDGSLFGLTRRLSPSEVLKVQRDPEAGFVASIEETPLERVPVTAEGVIRSSLFASASAAGLRDRTTLQLAEMFGWDIDFVLDLREGDRFKVTYERLSREGEYIGDGAILAAEFVNQGKAYRAVRFVAPDGKADYYTPEGKSLKKAFLKAPVEFSRISSVYNPNRRHPILNTIRAHRGVDYAAPTGTPIRAAGDGRVKFRGVKGGYGNVVEIEHSGKVVTLYGHVSRFAKGLQVGQRVKQGEVIAYVGKSGLATGPHLHFEYRVGGEWKNPQTVLKQAQPAPPIDASLREEFERQTRPLLASLDAPVPAPVSPDALGTGPAVAAAH